MRPAARITFTLLVGAGTAAWVLAALLLWLVVTRPESTVLWFADLGVHRTGLAGPR